MCVTKLFFKCYVCPNRAGTRNEPVGKEGLVHVLRMASSLTNKNSSQFALARSINQAGASLSCTAGREHIMYSVDVNRQQMYATCKICYKVYKFSNVSFLGTIK